MLTVMKVEAAPMTIVNVKVSSIVRGVSSMVAAEIIFPKPKASINNLSIKVTTM
jgi:hypothetical protein